MGVTGRGKDGAARGACWMEASMQRKEKAVVGYMASVPMSVELRGAIAVCEMKEKVDKLHFFCVCVKLDNF